jgi:C-terminal processing protease CtpA/Prc
MRVASFKILAGMFLLLAHTVNANAEGTVKDREGAVRSDKTKMESSERWIYNDVDAGFARAKETGKPLLVVLRCIPCLSCAGIDSAVLVEDARLTPLMDQFVLVRLINTNALELSKFQFDYDLSFSTMFFNGDGTLYARFGSWDHQHDAQNAATDGFRQALEGALALHQGYPANKAVLAGKQSPPSQYQTPLDIPAMDDRFRSELDWKGNVVKSCVHCHQIGDALRRTVRDKGELLSLQMIYPHPAPETIGIQLDPDKITHIAAVAPDSVAAKVGLLAGDRILSIHGQAAVSEADFRWALEQFSDSGDLPLEIERGGKTATVKLALEHGWRAELGMAKRVGNWPMRAMAFGGMRLEAMGDDDKKRNGIETDKMALLALNVGQYGRHALAKKQGFKKDDIIVEVDGDRSPLSEGDLMARILQTRKPGVKIPAKVLRNGKELDLEIPVQ